MQSITRSIFSMVIVGAVTLSGVMVADPSKCSPCQEKKSKQDALAQSIKDAQMAALAAGSAFIKASELDDEDVAKGCKPCQSRTNRDEVVADINPDEVVAACCEFCAEPGSLGCQGVNSANCLTCRNGLMKMSLAEVAATALALAQNVLDQAAQLDTIPTEVLPTNIISQNATRAPREELADPCNNCGSTVVNVGSCNNVSEQLQALRCCCASVAHQLARQGKDARKCCKRLRHKIEDVEELVETVIDQSADCCSLTETLLLSVIDQNADCCSLTETLLTSVIDQSAACCSSTDILLISIIDLITILIDL